MPRRDVAKPNVVERSAAVLMLSHCVPQPEGSAERVEAWRLLNEAASRGRVYLACVHDGPASLLEWRRLTWLAEAIVLEAPSFPSRVLRRVSKSLAHTTAAGVLRPVADAWQRQISFHAAVWTHPAFDRIIHPHLPFLSTDARIDAGSSLPLSVGELAKAA